MIVSGFGALVLAAAIPVQAGAVSAETPAAPKPAAEKKVCVAQPPATGSRLAPRPICRTRAEWAAIDGDTRSVARIAAEDELQRNLRLDPGRAAAEGASPTP